MTHESPGRGSTFHLIANTVNDLADLAQKEIRLARAELVVQAGKTVRASIWMAVAGLLAVFALIFALQAAALGIASYGVPLHWSCLIVAGALVVVAIIIALVARSGFGLFPNRAAKQIAEDIRTAKDRLR